MNADGLRPTPHVGDISNSTLRSVLAAAAGDHEHLPVWWRLTSPGDGSGLRLFAWCNDFFSWGSADLEPINDTNVATLREAIRDTRLATYDAPPNRNRIEGWLLFCARSRHERPQGAYYPSLHPETWPLFDDAGPSRAVGFGNPHPRPPTQATGPDPHVGADARPGPASQRPVFATHHATDPANVETVRKVMETVCFDFCDALRWTHDAGVLRTHVVAFDAFGPGSAETVELTQSNAVALLALYEAFAEAGSDAHPVAPALFVARERGLIIDPRFVADEVPPKSRHLFNALSRAHRPVPAGQSDA